MEGKRASTAPHTLHVCNRGEPDRVCRKKADEPAGHRAAMVVGDHIYYGHHYHLAFFRFAGQRVFRAVPLFYKLYQENWKKDRHWEGNKQWAMGNRQ